MKTTGILVSLIAGLSLVSLSYGQETEGFADQLKLKDYRPVSVFKLVLSRPSILASTSTRILTIRMWKAYVHGPKSLRKTMSRR